MGKTGLKLDFDISGVVADIHKVKLRMVQKESGLRIPEDQFLLSESVGMSFPREDGQGEGELLQPHYDKSTSKLFKSADRTRNVPPVPGAIEGIRALKEAHKVRFITNLRDEATQFYRSWLDMYGLQELKLHSSHHALSKSKLHYTLEADVVVDDSMKNLYPLVGMGKTLILFRGWGEHSPAEIKEFKSMKIQGFHFTDTWKEIGKIIQQAYLERQDPSAIYLKRALAV